MLVKEELSRSAIGRDQFAYKERCNTTLALLDCHHHRLKGLERALDLVRDIRSDFSKAFNSVQFQVLLFQIRY